MQLFLEIDIMILELIIGQGNFKIQEKGNICKIFYEASLADLKDIRKEKDIIYSDWIYHLSRKAWITIDVLYELAVIIKKEHPDVAFNWYETFYDVEKSLYQNNITELDINDEGRSKSLFENVLKDLRVLRKDTLSEDANEQLKEIVIEKIKQHKLI
jgi:hypothetical protein